jgi:hypothetical protein
MEGKEGWKNVDGGLKEWKDGERPPLPIFQPSNLLFTFYSLSLSET